MPPKRKRSGDDDNQDQDTVHNKRSYAYLKPHVRRIPEKTIKSKWTTLPDPVQDRVRELFHSLERPVIVRQPNERKRIEAQGAVQAVVRKYGYTLIHSTGFRQDQYTNRRIILTLLQLGTTTSENALSTYHQGHEF